MRVSKLERFSQGQNSEEVARKTSEDLHLLSSQNECIDHMRSC